MELLTEDQVERVYAETDRLRLHRDWVVVPLQADLKGAERMQPDGKLLLRPPTGASFDAWVGGLVDRLLAFDLNRTPRNDELDPKASLTSMGMPRFSGTQAYVWKRPPFEGWIQPLLN